MTILDGKAVSAGVKARIAEKVKDSLSKGNRAPCLAVIIVGENPASQVYVKNKIKDCAETGIISRHYPLPEATDEAELLALIRELNGDDSVDGILVQLPLPEGLDERRVIEAIDPKKDVDAFHPENAGRIMLGLRGFAPCTPSGIMRILKEYNIEIKGKLCTVIGRSNIVGKPMAMLLLAESGTVTVCHSKTVDLKKCTENADIIVVAVGKPGLLTGDMIKEGAVVVDVGMNRVDGKLCGDADFESCTAKASYITPVPGGVGPMTRAMLLENTMLSYERRLGL